MSVDDFLPYYQGKVQNMVVTTTSGQNVQFPVMHIRKYLISSGVNGYFCLETKNNKFISLTKAA